MGENILGATLDRVVREVLAEELIPIFKQRRVCKSKPALWTSGREHSTWEPMANTEGKRKRERETVSQTIQLKQMTWGCIEEIVGGQILLVLVDQGEDLQEPWGLIVVLWEAFGKLQVGEWYLFYAIDISFWQLYRVNFWEWGKSADN